MRACATDVADLGADAGHRVLRVTRKGARRAKVPLAPATVDALDAYLTDRARRGGLSDTRRLAGPLLATASGGRLRPGHLWGLVRRLAPRPELARPSALPAQQAKQTYPAYQTS